MCEHSDLRGLIRIMVFQEGRQLNKPHPFADIFRSWTETDTKGTRKNNFPCLGAETPVWQGARTAHTPVWKGRATPPDGMDRRPNRGSYCFTGPNGSIFSCPSILLSLDNRRLRGDKTNRWSVIDFAKKMCVDLFEWPHQ